MDAEIFNTLNALGLSVLLLLELRSQTFRSIFKDVRRMKRNLAFLLTSVAVGMLLHRSLGWLDRHIITPDLSLPLGLQLPAVFALGELLNWGLHWAKHKNGFLWRLHCPHHKDDQFTIWLTAHTYGPEILVSGSLINAAVLAAGFDVLALEIYLLFYSLTNAYQHSARPHSLGWLDWLIVNPAYHRHHHGGDQVNFGSTLTLWDVIFRTARFPRDRFEAVNPPPVSATPEPFGFVEEMAYPFAPKRWVRSRGHPTPTPGANR